MTPMDRGAENGQSHQSHQSFQPLQSLDLSEATLVGSGTYRDVYTYPGREDLVVKVLRSGAGYQPGRPIRNFLKARSSRQLYRFMFREFETYLESRLSSLVPEVPFPISHLCWLQETSLGLGMVAERVGGPNAGPARSLATLQKEGGITDHHLTALNRFIDALVRLDVIANDTNPGNVLLDETGPELRFVLVDGFGDPSPLGLKKIFKKLRQNARDRRFENMAEFLGLRWDAAQMRLVRE